MKHTLKPNKKDKFHWNELSSCENSFLEKLDIKMRNDKFTPTFDHFFYHLYKLQVNLSWVTN